MNPDCQKELFNLNGDIIEKAHIDAYCKTADNSFENLVVLCPNCHTDFDKNSAFSAETVLSWKKKRQEELSNFFSKKLSSFAALKKEVVPLLMENQCIFENYFLKDKKILWDAFEYKILSNNRKLKELLKNNLSLFQKNSCEEYSNLYFVSSFISHVDEFEKTRQDKEKIRQILFPKEIYSIFGICPTYCVFFNYFF